MRNKTETNRKTDDSELFLFTSQQKVNMTDHEDLKLMEMVLFGLPEQKHDSTSGLQWTYLKPDNFLIKSLKQMVGTLAHAVKKEAEVAEKDIKKAKKVFGG
jgi:hypothetical protein